LDAFALRVEGPRGVRLRCGLPESGTSAGVRLANGERLSVSMPDSSEHGSHVIARMLLFYVALTGLAAALVAYVLLTYLIVRPLERLTASAEQFARGAERIVVREQGSAEVVRLARTFNEMATMLRAERTQLTDRLAELERTTAALQTTERQLIHGEKLASVGRLAAGVAHEIGNPLAAILGLLSLVRDGDLTSEQSREFLARIAAETERVDSIIRGLLDFARRDGDEASGESCELRAAIDDAVGLLRPQKASRAVTIDVHVQRDLGPVLGAQRKLTQVILNLLLNALDALAGAGTIEIHAERDPRDEDMVLLRVEDDGPGIAPEIAHTLFEPFSTTKPAGQGTGLGLAVTHTIVESLSGRIEGFNRSSGGAAFVVRLRRARPAQVRAAV
jgi:C4-dicarboxylate-specific signal transduction histidine kinase